MDTTIRIKSIKFTHIHQWNHIQNKQFITSTVENSENDCELQWAEIQTKNKSVIIGSYYRPPNSNLDALNNLKSSIANVSEHSKDKPIILAGDFNLPHIDWENNTVKTGSNQVNHHQELIEIIEDSGMEQLQLKPSRENNILDLFLTNQPSIVKSCNTIPGISDHNIIIVDTDLENKSKRREINIFKKANWDQIKTYHRSRHQNHTKLDRYDRSRHQNHTK